MKVSIEFNVKDKDVKDMENSIKFISEFLRMGMVNTIDLNHNNFFVDIPNLKITAIGENGQ